MTGLSTVSTSLWTVQERSCFLSGHVLQIIIDLVLQGAITPRNKRIRTTRWPWKCQLLGTSTPKRAHILNGFSTSRIFKTMPLLITTLKFCLETLSSQLNGLLKTYCAQQQRLRRSGSATVSALQERHWSSLSSRREP